MNIPSLSLGIVVGSFLACAFAACSARDVDPCSPIAAAVIDQTCVETVDQVMKRECPNETTWTSCPKAVYALAACDLLIEEHARRCQ